MPLSDGLWPVDWREPIPCWRGFPHSYRKEVRTPNHQPLPEVQSKHVQHWHLSDSNQMLKYKDVPYWPQQSSGCGKHLIVGRPDAPLGLQRYRTHDLVQSALLVYLVSFTFPYLCCPRLWLWLLLKATKIFQGRHTHICQSWVVSHIEYVQLGNHWC